MGQTDESALEAVGLVAESADPSSILDKFPDILQLLENDEVSAITRSTGAERFSSLLWTADHQKRGEVVIDQSDAIYKLIEKYATLDDQSDDGPLHLIAKYLAEAVGAITGHNQELCAKLTAKAFHTAEVIMSSGRPLGSSEDPPGYRCECLSCLCGTIPYETEITDAPRAVPVIMGILRDEKKYPQGLRDACKGHFRSLCTLHKPLLKDHLDSVFCIFDQVLDIEDLIDALCDESLYELNPKAYQSNVGVLVKRPFTVTWVVLLKISEAKPTSVVSIVEYLEQAAMDDAEHAKFALTALGCACVEVPEVVCRNIKSVHSKCRTYDGCDSVLAPLLGTIGQIVSGTADEMVCLLMEMLQADSPSAGAPNQILLELEKLTCYVSSPTVITDNMEIISNFRTTSDELVTALEKFAATASGTKEETAAAAACTEETAAAPEVETAAAAPAVEETAAEVECANEKPADPTNESDSPTTDPSENTADDTSSVDNINPPEVAAKSNSNKSDASVSGLSASASQIPSAQHAGVTSSEVSSEIDDLRSTVSALKNKVTALEGALSKNKSKSTVCAVM